MNVLETGGSLRTWWISSITVINWSHVKLSTYKIIFLPLVLSEQNLFSYLHILHIITNIAYLAMCTKSVWENTCCWSTLQVSCRIRGTVWIYQLKKERTDCVVINASFKYFPKILFSLWQVAADYFLTCPTRGRWVYSIQTRFWIKTEQVLGPILPFEIAVRLFWLFSFEGITWKNT